MAFHSTLDGVFDGIFDSLICVWINSHIAVLIRSGSSGRTATICARSQDRSVNFRLDRRLILGYAQSSFVSWFVSDVLAVL
jgi:hypothetical protein